MAAYAVAVVTTAAVAGNANTRSTSATDAWRRSTKPTMVAVCANAIAALAVVASTVVVEQAQSLELTVMCCPRYCTGNGMQVQVTAICGCIFVATVIATTAGRCHFIRRGELRKVGERWWYDLHI